MSLPLLGVGKCSPNVAGPTNDPVHTIVSIANFGGSATLVTTQGDHGLADGNVLTMTGTSNAAYSLPNGPWAVSGNPPSATTFVCSAEYQGDSSGGEWQLVEV